MSQESRPIDRRSLLKGAAIGGAAVTVGALAPARLFSREGGESGGTTAASAGPPPSTEPIVAYLRDASKGEVVVMMGESEVVVQDGALAARIFRHAGSISA